MTRDRCVLRLSDTSVTHLNGRVPTGINGLDRVIGGGFFRGDVILVAGGTGSGKTILSSAFIYNGATLYKENGVYATFEEDAKTLKRNMVRVGFDLEKLEREGAVKVVDLLSLKSEGLSSNIEYIVESLNEINGKRLVIDSLTAFLSACEERFEYRTLMHLIYRMLKTRGYTTIMTCSVPTGATTLGLGIEEFIADSVIILESLVDDSGLKTRFLIRKMRGADHSRKYHNVVITDTGIQIVPFTTP